MKKNFFLFFSALLHLCGYFFLLRFIDNSKDYKPDTKIIFDIPSAITFFSLDPQRTKEIVGRKVRHLVKAWNLQYENKINVSQLYFFQFFT
jgi:hypothetical protein